MSDTPDTQYMRGQGMDYEAEDGVVCDTPNTQVRGWSMRLMGMGWFVIHLIRRSGHGLRG